MRLKEPAPMLPSSGWISTSRLERLASCLSTRSLPKKLISCPTMLSAEVICSRSSGGVEMFTAMITSPHILRATSIGRLFAMPVDEQAAVDLHRRHGARYGHARAHRAREVAVVENHRFARSDVGRHRAEGNRELPEIADAGRLLGQVTQEALDVHARHDALLEDERAVAHAELGREQALIVILLEARGDLGARRSVGEDLAPVGLRDDLLHFRRRGPRGERAADD